MISSCVLCLLCGNAFGQADAPPATPPATPAPNTVKADPAKNGRRLLKGEPTALAFKGVTVEQIIPFIVKATGKVIVPQQDILNRRVTVLNEEPIPLDKALDMVYLALAQNGVAVVENEGTILLRDVGEIIRTDLPVLGPTESSLGRTDVGAMVEKVFGLKHTGAKSMGDALKDSVPDYAKLRINEDSNQIAMIGTVSQIQRIEKLVLALDRPAAGALQTETFRLRFADADIVRENIEELYGTGNSSSSRQNNRRNQQNQQNNNPFQFGRQQPQGEQASSQNTELRVTSNAQQNSVTVVADPSVLEQIREIINGTWDKPLPIEAVVPRIYDLKYSDPVKVRDLLEGLFGRGTPGGSTAPGGQQGGGGGQAQQRSTGSSSSTQGVGRLAGQFSFQAIPDTGRLVVVSKSPDNLNVIDEIVKGLDQPQTAGLPSIIELKHASAEDLAEQLNALLSQDGTLAQVRRAESGLSTSSASSSPFAQQTTNTDTGTQNAQTDPATTAGTITFWWQRSRPPSDRRNSSNLVGQLRIVPVWRQNAVMVIAPPEYQESIVRMIERLDRPGRQVLLSAVVSEVTRDDSSALGLRWSNQAISPSNPDNALGVGITSRNTENNVATSLFDTSVLNANADLNLLLQALAQKNKVNVLSEPKIFTSDNQEADFFDGQDIPFLTDTQTSNTGSQIQSFDYRAVGIALRIRPRITVKGDVDLRVNIEISKIVQGQTQFGAFLVDRRETTTQLIVKNRQTIVISGILRSEDTEITRKVPGLGDIPLLGLLFQSKEKAKENTELLIFITPVVVENTEANDAVNEPYRQRLEELRQKAVSDSKKNSTKGESAPMSPGSDLMPVAPPPAKQETPDAAGGH
jgi:general secretion pathway protein D